MDSIKNKFEKLGVENAPGQEGRQKPVELELRGEKNIRHLIDFSHGDVDAHEPIPGSKEAFIGGFEEGGVQAYTEYRGKDKYREDIARKLSNFTGVKLSGEKNVIITPGTQGALFLAVGSLVTRGDKVCIVEPDYFANRKLVEFFEGEIIPVSLDYYTGEKTKRAGINLEQLEEVFKKGVKVFLFSNPNNPTGVVYTKDELSSVAKLATEYNVTVIADELYSRQIFEGYTHYSMINEPIEMNKLITIIGPSKTESLSGFRLGIGYGSEEIIERMEKLQAIVSLRAAGYNQAVLKNYFSEPHGWLEQRIKTHQEIRDLLFNQFSMIEGVKIRKTEGGSYIFPKLPPLEVSLIEFVRILAKYGNVIVTPGTEFGPKFTNHIRLNFSQSKENAIEGAQRIADFIERYRKF